MGTSRKPLSRYALIAVLILVGTAVAWWGWTRSPFYIPPLVDAAMSGDAEAARAAIARGAELNRRTWVFGAENFSGWTALMWAAHRRDTATLRLLLDSGADPKIQDSVGRNALHIVFYGDKVYSDSASCVAILLSGGVDPNSRTQVGLTPLSFAVTREDVDSIKVLIGAGADVNARDAHGFPVLSYAIDRKDPEIVRLLLKNGVDVAVELPSGERFYEVVAQYDLAPEIVEAIREAKPK